MSNSHLVYFTEGEKCGRDQTLFEVIDVEDLNDP